MNTLIIGGCGYAASTYYRKFHADVVDIDLKRLIETDFTSFEDQVNRNLNSGYDRYLLACVSLQTRFIKCLGNRGSTVNIIESIKRSLTKDTLLICTRASRVEFTHQSVLANKVIDDFIYKKLAFKEVPIEFIEYLNYHVKGYDRIMLGCTDLSYIKDQLKHPRIVDCCDLHLKDAGLV